MTAPLFQIGIALLSGGFIQWALPRVWQRFRSAETEISRESHIAALRKALDKAGIRFTGVTGACDALTLAHEITKAALTEAKVELPVAASKAVDIARQKLAEAVKALEVSDG